MRLTVFGATGRVGGHVVRQALDAGHEVTAVVRDPARFDVDSHPLLDLATVADLTEHRALVPALEDAEAVLSGIGPRSRKDVTVASTTTRSILTAMRDTGVRRIVVVSAAPVGPVPADDSFVNKRLIHPFFGAFLRGIYGDLARMEAELERSGVDWTSVRPPKLVDKPLSGAYREAIGANVPRGYSMSYADTAHAMLAALGDPATVKRPVGVAY